MLSRTLKLSAVALSALALTAASVTAANAAAYTPGSGSGNSSGTKIITCTSAQGSTVAVRHTVSKNPTRGKGYRNTFTLAGSRAVTKLQNLAVTKNGVVTSGNNRVTVYGFAGEAVTVGVGIRDVDSPIKQWCDIETTLLGG